MAVDSKHPEYIEFLPDWQAMRDTFRGERSVKKRERVYLPATKGMTLDGMGQREPGREMYDSYRIRAVFHNFVGEGVETLLGMMWNKPPTIELPEIMEDMREKATVKSESLEMLLRRVNEEQLITGRVGLLLDLPTGESLDAEILPYVAIYKAESIINWDDGQRDELSLQNLNLVALDESENERTEELEWDFICKTRLLLLGDTDKNEGKGGGIYRQGVFTDVGASFSEEAMITPMFRGNTLDEIPFVFINSKDIVVDADDPPLLDLAKLSLAIYRGEADYRQSLFMQGQDTLVITGGDADAPVRTGAGATIHLPIGGKAEFIGVASEGLKEQREALENDKIIAAKKSGSLAQKGAQVESGDAMKIRFGATTASLTQLAITGAFGLQALLRIQAKWMGADPEQVIVTPNLDFSDAVMESKTLLEYMGAKTMGAPLSMETIHARMQEQGITDLEFDEELEKIANEEPMTGSATQLGLEAEEREAGRVAASQEEETKEEETER